MESPQMLNYNRMGLSNNWYQISVRTLYKYTKLTLFTNNQILHCYIEQKDLQRILYHQTNEDTTMW